MKIYEIQDKHKIRMFIFMYALIIYQKFLGSNKKVESDIILEEIMKICPELSNTPTFRCMNCNSVIDILRCHNDNNNQKNTHSFDCLLGINILSICVYYPP